MNIDEFKTAYGESRNGANYFVRHWYVRSFQFSDGVEQCAAAGCFWLIDIIATECLNPLADSGDNFGILEVKVSRHTADLSLTIGDDEPPIWSRHMDFADMPDGEWKFYLANEGERFALILPSEY